MTKKVSVLPHRAETLRPKPVSEKTQLRRMKRLLDEAEGLLEASLSEARRRTIPF